MTDIEISKALAYVIGWRAPHMTLDGDKLRCWRGERQWGWQVFDYMDWRVIGPIAAKYKLSVDFGDCAVWKDGSGKYWYGDTPQKAIALAVIQGAKK